LEGLLAVVGLAVTTEGIRTGISTERWRERVPDFRAATLKLRALMVCGQTEQRDHFNVC